MLPNARSARGSALSLHVHLGEEGRGSFAAGSHQTKRIQNALNDLVQVVGNVAIPEPKHPIASRLQLPRASLICIRRRLMRAAIELDHKAMARAAEVRHISADCVLPAETSARELMPAQL
jgi:hypothetical protein